GRRRVLRFWRSPMRCRCSISAGRCSGAAGRGRIHGTQPGSSGRRRRRRRSTTSSRRRSSRARPIATRRRRSRKMPDAQPAFQFADLRQQHEVAQLGMWTFLGTEVLFFGGLILAYAVYRFGYPGDFAAAAPPTTIAIGSTNTAILLTSSFLVAWAVAAARLEAAPPPPLPPSLAPAAR